MGPFLDVLLTMALIHRLQFELHPRITLLTKAPLPNSIIVGLRISQCSYFQESCVFRMVEQVDFRIQRSITGWYFMCFLCTAVYLCMTHPDVPTSTSLRHAFPALTFLLPLMFPCVLYFYSLSVTIIITIPIIIIMIIIIIIIMNIQKQIFSTSSLPPFVENHPQ